MKKTMKFFAALAIMMGFTVSATAQNTANGIIKGKATVMQSIVIIPQTALDFGIIAQGAVKTIGLTNNVTGLPNQGPQTTGRFLVSAAATTSIMLSFVSPANLRNGEVQLPIDTYTYGWDIANNYSSGTSFTSGASVTMPTNLVETVNGIYVFVGATVKPTTTQAIGSYVEDITLTATYN